MQVVVNFEVVGDSGAEVATIGAKLCALENLSAQSLFQMGNV